MRNMQLGMLSTLMCVLAAWADVSPVSDFDLAKIAGKWFKVGMATNAQWFVNHKADMKLGTATLVPTDIGDLDISYATLNADHSCCRMNYLANKTETHGRFTFHSHVWNDDNDMRIVDVVYDEYALVHTTKMKNGEIEVLNILYCRSPVVSDLLQQKFTQFSLKSGVDADNIVIFPPNAECPQD